MCIESAKAALEQSLGESVSDTDVQRFLEDSAKEAAAEAMKAAMASTSLNATQKEAIARDEAKKALKQSLGKDDVSEAELQSFLMEGAKDAVANTMKACMERNSVNEKAECRSKSVKNIGKQLGKATVSSIELKSLSRMQRQLWR